MLAKRSVLLALALLFVSSACGRDAPKEPESSSRSPLPAQAPAGPAQAGGVRYLERITGGAEADANAKLPLVVAIHGLGDNPESFGHLFDGFSSRARLILPYGLTAYGDGFSWFPISNMDPKLLAEGTEKAARALAAMLEELERSRPTQGRPIVTGFSQGGMLSFTLAVLHPDRLGFAVPIAGLVAPPLYPSSWPMGKLAPEVHALHGDADARVPTQGARDTVKMLSGLGFVADLKEYPGVGHSISAEMRRDLYQALEQAIAKQGR